MKKTDVEKKLKKAVERTTPDIKKKVVAECRNADMNTQPFVIKNIRRRKRENIYAAIAIAAVLLLVCNVVLSSMSFTRSNRAVTVIDIDVNPSIELKVNQNDQIVSVRAINQDAEAILDGMELKGTQTKVAVNAIVGSMVKHGYLQGNTDSILVSVNNKDEKVSEQIQTDITTDIDELMRAYSRDVEVIGQTIEPDKELTELSSSYSISEGKAALIRKIIDFNSIYTMEELAPLTISELNEIICSMENMNNNNIDNQVENVPADEVIEEPIVSEEPETVSSNEVVSDNQAVSENEVDANTETVSDNEITDDNNDEQSISENEIDESSDSVSDNQVSENGIIGEPEAITSKEDGEPGGAEQ